MYRQFLAHLFLHLTGYSLVQHLQCKTKRGATSEVRVMGEEGMGGGRTGKIQSRNKFGVHRNFIAIMFRLFSN